MNGMEGAAALGAVSPWWWVGATVLFGVFERLSGAAALLWAEIAALSTAAALWFAPDLSFAAQLALFGLLSVALAGFARLRPDPAAARARRAAAAALVGREAEVLAFQFHEGQVVIDGAVWPARLDGASSRTPRIGQRMRVTGADGKVVWVAPF